MSGEVRSIKESISTLRSEVGAMGGATARSRSLVAVEGLASVVTSAGGGIGGLVQSASAAVGNSPGVRASERNMRRVSGLVGGIIGGSAQAPSGSSAAPNASPARGDGEKENAVLGARRGATPPPFTSLLN